MEILIHGYGQMGREVEAAAHAKGFSTRIVDTEALEALVPAEAGQSVIVDFSHASVVERVVVAALRSHIALVIGTTGWNDKQAALRSKVEQEGGSVIIGSNFSGGMNIFMQTLRQTASLAEKAGNFDIGVMELHHRRKADAPGGTALSLANIIIEESRKENIHTAAEPPKAEDLHIGFGRIGEIFGIHTVIIDGEADAIELTHRAKSRKGFAQGAVLAARWIATQKGWFDFSEIFPSMLNTK